MLWSASAVLLELGVLAPMPMEPRLEVVLQLPLAKGPPDEKVVREAFSVGADRVTTSARALVSVDQERWRTNGRNPVDTIAKLKWL